jgi:hypothetical protein
MKYVLIVALLLLLSTVRAKYLGIFGVLSMENVLGENVTIVQCSLLLSLVIWFLLQNYTAKEGLTEMEEEELQYKPLDVDFSSAPSGNISDFIEQPTLTQGLTVDNVTPKPIYYEPGTVKYGGLGYKPSYADIQYYSNAQFYTKPETVASSPGFCSEKDNIMIDMDEKCNALSGDVCGSTECCVSIGGKCVHGHAHGPDNKKIYSDTTLKNTDAYYYMNKCYGNCV